MDFVDCLGCVKDARIWSPSRDIIIQLLEGVRAVAFEQKYMVTGKTSKTFSINHIYHLSLLDA